MRGSERDYENRNVFLNNIKTFIKKKHFTTNVKKRNI